MSHSNFYNYIYERAKKVYGENLVKIKDQLDFELERIEAMGIDQEFLAAEFLINSYKRNQTVYLVKGSVGSLCVSYILGITQIDPIEYKIPWEMALGEDGHKIPQFEIVHDGTGLFRTTETTEIMKTRRFIYNSKKIDTYNSRVWEYFSAGKYPSNIGMDDVETEKVLKVCHPSSITDLAKAISIALSHGVYSGNSERLVEEGILRIQDIPSTREDLLELFIEHNIPKEVAHSIVHFVRTGRKIPKRFDYFLVDAHLPYWLIPFCEKVKYLMPRSYCLDLAITTHRIVSTMVSEIS